jgi:phytoene synthase
VTLAPVPDTRSSTDLTRVCDQVRERLVGVCEASSSAGGPGIALEGKLLRPLVAYVAVPAAIKPSLPDEFWHGALAVQMVHEASLLHDDVLDGATERRGEASLHHASGVAAALCMGDRLLTASYLLALDAGTGAFTRAFASAVAHTVQGEMRQQSCIGRRVDASEYRAIIEGKSGELFAAAIALAAEHGATFKEPPHAVGLRVGALYQMVDDVLDYCPALPQGKPAFGDLQQKKWTFVLDELGFTAFPASEREVMTALFGPTRGADRVLQRLDAEVAAIVGQLASDDGLLPALLASWTQLAREGLGRQEDEHARSNVTPSRQPSTDSSAEAFVVTAARAVGGPEAWDRYFSHHSKTFRFSARLFPTEARRATEGVYAFCRFSDDLVDEESVPADVARARLQIWRELANEAYEGRASQIRLLDTVMGDMASRGVPFVYADELLQGMAMDIGPVEYQTLDELAVYTYRVASVVGGWMTEMFGVRSPELLQRAFDMGHAMQLTNIIRDVGEDLRNDRLYVPLELLQRYDITRLDLVASAVDGAPMPERWPDVLELLMAKADRHYEAAFQVIPALPVWYARPVAVASRVYQGIHGAVRAARYDNLTHRAHTGRIDKLRLGMGALRDLSRLRRTQPKSRGAFVPDVSPLDPERA